MENLTLPRTPCMIENNHNISYTIVAAVYICFFLGAWLCYGCILQVPVHLRRIGTDEVGQDGVDKEAVSSRLRDDHSTA